MSRVTKVIGKSKVNKESLAVEQTILPSSWVQYHPAMQWPENVYGGRFYNTPDGIGKVAFSIIPSVPKSWEMIYGVRN